MAKATKSSDSSLVIEVLGRFGEFDRYRLERLTSRRPLLVALGSAITYAVFDAEVIDEVTGRPAMIRQEDTIGAAVGGLCDAHALAKLTASDVRVNACQTRPRTAMDVEAIDAVIRAASQRLA